MRAQGAMTRWPVVALAVITLTACGNDEANKAATDQTAGGGTTAQPTPETPIQPTTGEPTTKPGAPEAVTDPATAENPTGGEPMAGATTPGEMSREGALDRRPARRAFEGAPPLIPHVVDQTTHDCRACHQKRVTVAGNPAPVMPHRIFQSCQQCHVQANNPFFAKQRTAGGPLPAGSNFEPVPIGKGVRAHAAAPPQIPHPTAMREQCTACHGKLGYEGMKTTHPERTLCRQCHVVGGELNQWASESPGPEGW